MKKGMILTVLTLLLMQFSYAQDKAFQKGDFSVSLGAGIGIFQTTSTYAQDFIDGSGNVVRYEVKETGGAASAIYPLALEYGITNWFGMGARLAYSKYFANGDSTNQNIVPTVYAIDAGANLYFHFVKTVHFDMPIVITAGWSGFTYKTNDALQDKAKDNGLTYGVALTPRIIFGKHVGMYFNVGYLATNYPSMVYSNKDNSNLNAVYTDNFKYTLKGSGMNYGLGLICKF